MKTSKLLAALMILLLPACAGLGVDKAALDLAQNKVFRISTIKAPCDLHGIPSLESYNVRTQKKILRRIDHQEILKILSDAYGLQFAKASELEIDSYPMRLAGFFSDSTGRCASYKNVADTDNQNIIDIEYDLTAKFFDAKATVAKFNYKVQVKSGKKILVLHTGIVETFNYDHWLTKDDFELIIDSAEKIPEALKRDIEGAKK